ncbi:hypothetical protein [Paenibacillus gansuensis]|uniref:Integral membrane protein n=1 Tax=Paenibacillus gansuensis TaxID=306542 RepID=A0ABW5PBV6_9BACL
MLTSISAILFTVLIGIVVLFQLALAAGVPWGSYAMGGKFPGKYPPSMRVTAIFQVLILMFLAFVVLIHSGILVSGWVSFAKSAIWFVVIFSLIASILNVITKSIWERKIWAPVSILMLITSVIVAIGS